MATNNFGFIHATLAIYFIHNCLSKKPSAKFVSISAMSNSGESWRMNKPHAAAVLYINCVDLCYDCKWDTHTPYTLL